MMEIDVEKIKIFFLSYLYFPKEENYNKEKNEKKSIPLYEYENLLKNKEIEKLELLEQTKDFNRKANFLYGKNKFKIEMKISNKKFNDFQRKFDYERKELKEEKKDLTVISLPQPKMDIYFNLSDIEFMFYKANFASIVNNKQNAQLFIYLKKFEFEIEITRRFNKKDIKYYFPYFPDLDTKKVLNNLKFHDVIFSFNLKMVDLFDIMFIYEHKFKLIKNIIIKQLNSEGEIVVNDEETEEEKEEDEEEDYENYDVNVSFEILNHDIIWHLLCLVSERFISYYTLIIFLNKYNKELNGIIKKDEYLFIILLRNILRAKYNLSKIKIKFFNPESFLEYIKININNKLDENQQKEYDLIKNIYNTNEIRDKYFRYNLNFTPLTLEFIIPFLKMGLFLVDKFNKEFKSYDLIYLNFQNYKKINDDNKIIDKDIQRYLIYNIINKDMHLFNINYVYLGATKDDMKHQKCLFINEAKKSFFNLKKEIFKIRDEKDLFFINEILFNEDIAAYTCEHKSIKKFKENFNNNFFFHTGVISSTLKQKIKEKCKISNFNSCYGIIRGFLGNFTVRDEYKYNYKNRIVINPNIILSNNNNNKNIIRDTTLYILNIFRYNPGILDNTTIDFLNIINSEKFVQSIIKNIFNLNIENIYNRVPISKLKFFLNLIKDTKKDNNEFVLEIKKAFLNYQYNLIQNNIIEIPDSAILNGIFDEYNIMKKVPEDSNCICVIIDNEKYGGIKYLKGYGYIFVVRKKYLHLDTDDIGENNENSGDKVCKIEFFDLEKYEDMYQNTYKYEKIQKTKNMKNVIIFPKNSKKLFDELNIRDISQQEYFITWNKTIYDNIDSKSNKQSNINSKNNKNIYLNHVPAQYKKVIKNPMEYMLPKNLKNKNQVIEMHNCSRKHYYSHYNILLNNKIKYKAFIDYKDLMRNLLNKKELYTNLNELELFYLEYIPKCTLIIKHIANELKELMQIYSVNNVTDLLIGNINIQIDSKNYFKEIENINDDLLRTFNQNLEFLTSEFRYLQNQELNSKQYLSQYKEKMFIVTSIIYNICNYPQKIEKIIDKYNDKIAKIIKHKTKSSQEKFIEYNNDIEIKDCFDNDINKFGADFYLLFESDKLINDNIKKDNDINISLSNKNNDKERKELKFFFEDFQIILNNEKEIKKLFIPELLLYKYLRQLNIDFI